jgi:hypothetical protein
MFIPRNHHWEQEWLGFEVNKLFLSVGEFTACSRSIRMSDVIVLATDPSHAALNVRYSYTTAQGRNDPFSRFPKILLPTDLFMRCSSAIWTCDACNRGYERRKNRWIASNGVRQNYIGLCCYSGEERLLT